MNTNKKEEHGKSGKKEKVNFFEHKSEKIKDTEITLSF